MNNDDRSNKENKISDFFIGVALGIVLLIVIVIVSLQMASINAAIAIMVVYIGGIVYLIGFSSRKYIGVGILVISLLPLLIFGGCLSLIGLL